MKRRSRSALGALRDGLIVLLCAVVGSACDRSSSQAPGAVSSASSAPSSSAASVSIPRKPRLENLWDPKTGRGDLRHWYSNGDVLRTCFQCAYDGYTGGLVIGNFRGSGLGLYPAQPIRGFQSINVFCAQDESIWDHDERAEYTYGWSENYGTGDDGHRLEYVRGRVLPSAPGELILQSENAGGCYRVTKIAHTRVDWRMWIMATRISNRCDHDIRFDFFTGDDPWLGRYLSSEGDVGWTPDGLVEHEASIEPFVVGGLLDLGNPALGQSDEGFSNQANFIWLDPGTSLPDRAFFANRFAHSHREIDAKQPLTNKSRIALNLGWVDVRLHPGEGLSVAYALGLAKTGEPGQIPEVPLLSDQDWSVWRRHLKETVGTAVRGGVDFVAEAVHLDVTDKRLQVEGTYHLRNNTDGVVVLNIDYPVAVDAEQAAPTEVSIDERMQATKELRSGLMGVAFPVTLPPRGLVRFRIRYAQALSGHKATYLVTTANDWPLPISRAVFSVRHPAGWRGVRTSYPVASTRTDRDSVVRTIVRRNFAPRHEVVVTW